MITFKIMLTMLLVTGLIVLAIKGSYTDSSQISDNGYVFIGSVFSLTVLSAIAWLIELIWF